MDKRARRTNPRDVRGPSFIIALVSFVVALLPYVAGQESTVEVYDLRSYTHPTHTRVVVDVGKLREFSSAELKAPDRIYIDIYQARLNPILEGKAIVTKCDYLREIRIAQKNETTVRVVVEIIPAAVERFQVFPLFDPFRIVLDIYPKAGRPGAPTAKPAPEQPPQAAQSTPGGYSMARQLGLGIRTVVIDAGHGGEDPGAVGRKGQKEKEVVLDVALGLRDLLVSKGLNVSLTRESDIYIPLENRTVIANQKAADIFISIHANANRKRSRRGVQTFFLNFSPDPQVIEVAARENATSTRTIGQMKDTLGKIVRNSKILESRDLADKIQRNLVKSLSQHYSAVENLGVRGGPFWVLIGGEMPSVLVEISHLSNPQEEDRLRSAPYRKQVAQGIYDGLIEYMRSLGKG